jgi:hypothetical protein
MKFRPYIFITLLFFQGLTACAQSFTWQANLEKVTANGFYNIALTPDFVSRTANRDLADIRIFEKNKEIAYLLRKESDSASTQIPAPAFKVKQVKASQQSIVEINFNKAYQVNKLTLTAAGFKFYRRAAWLAELNPDFKNKRNRNGYIRLVDFIILSGKPATIDLYGENRYKKLYLFIENEDNSPLEIKKIDAYQQNLHLTAYLEKDKVYTIKTGQLNMNLPRYDLSYFNDSISNSVPFIKVGDFNADPGVAKVVKVSLTGKAWMWITLTILIAFIGYLSYNMIRDMQRKKQEKH